MFQHDTRPHHFIYPTVIAIVGGIFMRIQGWEYIGWIIIANAVANVFFLIYSAVKDQDLKRIQEEHYHYAEIIRLDVAKTMTKVVIDKTSLEGNEFSQSHSVIKIDPARLKIFATKVLNGQPMTIREWTPLKKGKLFSDGEWRRLTGFMKHPVEDRDDIAFIVPINPKDERKGYTLTPAGETWLENIVDNRVIAYAPK